MRVDTSGWVKGTFVGYVDIIKPQSVTCEGDELLWHIVITEPGRETRAIEHIQGELGLKCYWPHLHKRVPGGRRRSREIEVSMFPSRVLVLMPQTALAWHRVRSTRRVVDFMMQSDGRHLATLPDPIVDEIKKVEAKKNGKYLQKLATASETPFSKGRQVWVEIMPLRKMLGSIEELDAQGRIEVLLEAEIFGRRVWPVKPHLVQFADG